MVGVSLGDTTGMATPPLVVERCRHLKEHVPELPITLHFHNTRGLGLVNVMAGLDEGVDSYESSFAGPRRLPVRGRRHRQHLHRGPRQPPERARHRDRDRPRRLCGVARRVEEVIGRPLPGQVMKAGPRLRLSAADEVRDSGRLSGDAAFRHPRRRSDPHPGGAVLHPAAGRPRRRGDQGRAARPRRSGARPGCDQGRPQLVLRPVQSQQEVDHARSLHRRGQGGAGRPDPPGRRAGRELSAGRARRDGLSCRNARGAQPGADRGLASTATAAPGRTRTGRRSTSSPRR